MQQCVGQQCLFMEEQLMMQQQQMEEDQRWLEQEERLLVTHTLEKQITVRNNTNIKSVNLSDSCLLLCPLCLYLLYFCKVDLQQRNLCVYFGAWCVMDVFFGVLVCCDVCWVLFLLTIHHN